MPTSAIETELSWPGDSLAMSFESMLQIMAPTAYI